MGYQRTGYLNRNPWARVVYRKRKAQWKRVIRAAAMRALGNCCLECGCADLEVLQLDHINGDGHKWTSKGDSRYMLELKRQLRDGTLKQTFQLLCASCHLKKTKRSKDYLNLKYRSPNTTSKAAFSEKRQLSLFRD